MPFECLSTRNFEYTGGIVYTIQYSVRKKFFFLEKNFIDFHLLSSAISINKEESNGNIGISIDISKIPSSDFFLLFDEFNDERRADDASTMDRKEKKTEKKRSLIVVSSAKASERMMPVSGTSTLRGTLLCSNLVRDATTRLSPSDEILSQYFRPLAPKYLGSSPLSRLLKRGIFFFR